MQDNLTSSENNLEYNYEVVCEEFLNMLNRHYEDENTSVMTSYSQTGLLYNQNVSNVNVKLNTNRVNFPDVVDNDDGDDEDDDEREEIDEVDRERFEELLNNLEKPSFLCLPFHCLSKLCPNLWGTGTTRKGEPKSDQRKLPYKSHGMIQIIYDNIIGLLFGILIGFIVYAVFVTLLAHSPHASTLLSAYAMMFSIFALAFSSDFRCIALLFFPYLTTSRIRWLLLMYATSLCIGGPGLNFLYNFETFRNSLACIISQISTNLMILKTFNNSPFSVLKVSIESFISELNSMLHSLRTALSTIHSSVLQLIVTMEKNAGWIESIRQSCGNTDVLRNLCTRFLNKAYLLCVDELTTFSGLCHHLKFVSIDLCTKTPSMIGSCDSYVETIESRIKFASKNNLTEKMNKIINIIGKENLTLLDNFDDYIEVTNEMDDIIAELLRAQSAGFIRKIEHAKEITTWILLAWSLFTMIQLIVKAAIFRNSWLNKETFDNHYITKSFIKQVSGDYVAQLNYEDYYYYLCYDFVN
uniref:Dendritic cell-specific transmembrane protein-like domain-containing protein n=1 Tax=Trichobilharzia regenti TaxID=157069 RepID=A0AA85JZL9_TRIRE|nr:unnamed protein product [Trichobilharzia regenti]